MLASPRQLREGRWIECLVQTPEGDLISGVMAADGLLYRFQLSDLAQILISYPSDQDGWYWNSSRDRYCVERDFDAVNVNPAFVDKHFTDRVYS